jgi:hypothetical protein
MGVMPTLRTAAVFVFAALATASVACRNEPIQKTGVQPSIASDPEKSGPTSAASSEGTNEGEEADESEEGTDLKPVGGWGGGPTAEPGTSPPVTPNPPPKPKTPTPKTPKPAPSADAGTPGWSLPPIPSTLPSGFPSGLPSGWTWPGTPGSNPPPPSGDAGKEWAQPLPPVAPQ